MVVTLARIPVAMAAAAGSWHLAVRFPEVDGEVNESIELQVGQQPSEDLDLLRVLVGYSLAVDTRLGTWQFASQKSMVR